MGGYNFTIDNPSSRDPVKIACVPFPHTVDQRISKLSEVSDLGNLLAKYITPLFFRFLDDVLLPKIKHLRELKVVHCFWELISGFFIEAFQCLEENFVLHASPLSNDKP